MSPLYLQVLFVFEPLHWFEQQSAASVQEAPAGEHWQTAAQSASSQSVSLSQSSSMPSLHWVSVVGGVPQSAAQLHESSVPLQLPSPQ